MASELNAYVRLSDQLNFKRIFGDFKFIHIFLIPLNYNCVIDIEKKFSKLKLDLNLKIIVFVLCALLFIPNQLLTSKPGLYF